MTILHPQLAKDCLVLGQFSLCKLLLMKDANYPWFILVPDREEITEIFQLNEKEQQQLICESSQLSIAVMKVFNGDKLNIGALGNIVPQLHLHHIVRYKTDLAWPEPVWGKIPRKTYNELELNDMTFKVKSLDLKKFRWAI